MKRPFFLATLAALVAPALADVEAELPDAYAWLTEPQAGSAATCGGPGGNFDFQVPDGLVFTFNTASTIFTGGPNFLPTTQVLVTDGILHVRNLRIGNGAVLRCEGPHPVQIFATGDVEILGEIHADGFGSVGVVTLNTTNVPEIGAPGVCGGGRGGTGSPLTTQSSPQGGQGFGAFGALNGGGFGGEAGWATNTNKNNRRGAGGGGGVFRRDQLKMGQLDESLIGLNAEDGFDGGPNALGALDPQAMAGPPQGGAKGPSIFQDGIVRNDFYGKQWVPSTGQVIEGELSAPSAGTGGGGGGDASFVSSGIYPNVPFSAFGDEKGGSGGGGGGSLFVVAKGSIRFGPLGLVSARGGYGGGGESTNFIDRVGSAGGGGSGGHVILQAGISIDMTQCDPFTPAILATGGQGGAGANDNHGASIAGPGPAETNPADDACPDASLGCFGPYVGAGGDGGPGVIQLHVRGGSGNILLPFSATFGNLVKPFPLLEMIPFPFPPCALPSTAETSGGPSSSWLQRVRVPGLLTR